MAYFWSFILALVVVTGVLASGDLFQGTEPAREQAAVIELPAWEGVVAADIAAEEAVADEGIGEDADVDDPEPVPSEGLVRATEGDARQERPGPVEGSVEIAAATSDAEPTPDPEPEPETETDLDPEAAESEDAGGDIVIDPEVLARLAAAQQATEEPEDADPGYTINDDGSLVVKTETGELTIPGRGTASSAYVISWDVLRSVQRQYDPKKSKDDLPGWLGAIDGKQVVIEGNTLVALVASETDELLVMQNPWDGCCIGVPPTPYDAVEVKLNRPVTFGYSAVGYGAIKGTMKIDPYVVSGWLMGLYVIEDATYTSGEGEELSDF